MARLLDEVAQRLIAADTVSTRSAVGALEALGERLEGLGFETRLHRYEGAAAPQANLVAAAGPPEPGGLILSGHVDVVPFADQPGWSREPLALAMEGERVYGRGTADMKVFVAQCVAAAAELDLTRLARPVVLVFTAEEEIGCLGAGRLAPVLAELLGERPLPRWAWIGEPTAGRIYHAHKGVVVFQVRVRGRGGHSGVPEAGANAIAVAAQAAAAIGEIQRELRARPSAALGAAFAEAPYTTLNLGTIRGGTAVNMIPETCELAVSYRPLPDEPPTALYERIRERLAAGPFGDWASDVTAAIELGEPLVAPGLATRRDTPLERALARGFPVDPAGGAPFCTDAGQLAAVGIDVLLCGPGELNQAHRPDESLPRRAYEGGPAEIGRVVRELCVDR